MSPLPEAQIVDGISQNALLSIELWAASKIIGRECASVNGAFYHCKSLKGDEPSVCEEVTQLARVCPTIVTNELNAKFPTEYKAFQACLDYNDYRFYDCRKEEKALHDCWNKEKKYTAVEQK